MKLKYRRLFRSDLLSFADKALRKLQGIRVKNQPYVAWICKNLSDVSAGEINRLIVNAPPRHLKTLLCAVCFAAYELGLNPATCILIVSYSEDLAKQIADLIRDIVRWEWYQEVFPATLLKADHSRSGDFETTRGGGVRGISIYSRHAGMGATLVIIDDPLDLHEWNDEAAKEKVINNLQGMILSRFNNSKMGRVVFVAHRLNEDDTTAALLRTGKWKHVVLPFRAIKTETYDLGYAPWQRKKGELLRPDAFLDEEVANLPTTQKTPPYEWFHQQGVSEPPPIALKRRHFRLFGINDVPSNCHYVLSVDTSYKANDRSSYNVIQAWATDGRRHWLMLQWREQCSYQRLEDEYLIFAKEYQPSAVLIEDTANGGRLLEKAQKNPRLRVIPVTPDRRSKTRRLNDNADVIVAGRVYLPRYAREMAEAFIAEHVGFPRCGTDQVDATTQYLDFMRSKPFLQKPAPAGTAGMTFASSNFQLPSFGSSSSDGAPRAFPGDVRQANGCSFVRRQSAFPIVTPRHIPSQPGRPVPIEVVIKNGPGIRKFNRG